MQVEEIQHLGVTSANAGRIELARGARQNLLEHVTTIQREGEDDAAALVALHQLDYAISAAEATRERDR